MNKTIYFFIFENIFLYKKYAFFLFILLFFDRILIICGLSVYL